MPVVSSLFPAAITNTVAIANNGKYDFNPVSDVARFPANVQGACKVSAPGKNFVAFVQMRYVNVLPNEFYPQQHMKLFQQALLLQNFLCRWWRSTCPMGLLPL